MKQRLLCFLFFIAFLGSRAQLPYVFQHLGVEEGINDGHVHVIGQDKYGYIWFASLGALCRYDGYTIKTYTGSVPGLSNITQNLITCFHCTKEGRFFLGSEKGLYEYEYKTDTYHRIKGSDSLVINRITSLDANFLYIACNKGLLKYSLSKHTLQSANLKDLAQPIENMSAHFPFLYLSVGNEVLQYNTVQQTSEILLIKNKPPLPTASTAMDESGNLWISFYGSNSIYRWNHSSGRIDSFLLFNKVGHPNRLTHDHLFVDTKNQVWILSREKGIYQFNCKTQKLEEFKIDLENGVHSSENKFLCFFESRDGHIWLTGRIGIIYFKPKAPWIETIKPFPDHDTGNTIQLSRVSVEDHQGHLWLGTINGLIRIDSGTGKRTFFTKDSPPPNKMEANAIRALACDNQGRIWVATGNGLHIYDPAIKKMRRLSETDSFPVKNFICLRKDHEGYIWTGTTNPFCIYRIDPQRMKITSIDHLNFPIQFRNLGIWSMYQDSRDRYWFGFFNEGIGMFNPHTKEVRTWHASDHCDTCIAGNSVIDIREEKNGIIWISTFHGISSLDVEKHRVKSYTSSNGLLSNTCSGLIVDDANRVWVCSGRGLMMLDSQRKYVTSFGRYDGLPSLEFPQEYPAYMTRRREIIMGSKEGFIRFNPMNYVPEKQFGNVLLQSFRVNDSIVHGHELNEMEEIRLKTEENFFTIGFAAINFGHSNNIHYAYKLDGVNKDWVYSDNRYAEYTHIAGGDYIFRCKASSTFDLEHATEKLIRIHIDTPYYQTLWFKLFIIVSIMLIFIVVYRYRMKQRETVLQLKSQAYLLEKEKVQVMYENLKQHLNPHFLFNSLTSLGSLIRSDQNLAGKFLDNISKVYRYILQNRDNELVSLSDEIRFVSMYIDLQKTRFGNALQVEIDLLEDQRYYKIAPVTLQNLVENAIKHNIADEEEPLVIRIFIQEEYLLVQNNLQRKQFVESSNKQGLAGMISLYRFLTDLPFLIIEDEKYFTVKIPLL